MEVEEYMSTGYLMDDGKHVYRARLSRGFVARVQNPRFTILITRRRAPPEQCSAALTHEPQGVSKCALQRGRKWQHCEPLVVA